MKKTIIALTTLVLSLSMAQAFAESSQHHQPPPEAFEICEGQSEGDSVSITTPHGDIIDATCQLMDEKLVAVPKHMPPPRGDREQD